MERKGICQELVTCRYRVGEVLVCLGSETTSGTAATVVVVTTWLSL